MKPLLIEIGVEELPGVPLVKELPVLHEKYKAACKAFNLDIESVFEYTPRRLVFWHPRCPERQPDVNEELFGPPEESAFKDGSPTPAAIGFAKKCGVEIESLGFAEQKGRRVLYYQKSVPGKAIEWVIGPMIEQFLKSLNFGKTMRWGSHSFEFVRPVRSLIVLHGEQAVRCGVFGVQSAAHSFGHRMFSYDPQPVGSAENFEDFLLKRGVMLSAAKRRAKVLADFAALEQANSGLSIERDETLLDEIVAITEHPTALLGAFDQRFLELPEEVIITTMKSHQRYFPVFKNGKLTSRFVVVSNALTDDFKAVIAGNEKVLRPRLSDALFFWNNDLSKGLSSEGLKSIMYVQGLGTLHDKLERERKIAALLTTFFGLSDPHIQRAAELSKADLTTQMVYEFTELQGVMGMHYARAAGENETVAKAIYEQYLPLGEASELPASQTGALLSLATKLDSLMALFSIGHIPSGSKDPLALRRAAASVIRIVLDRGWRCPLGSLIGALGELYKPFDRQLLIEFIQERLLNVLEVNPSVLKAVLETGEADLLRIAQKTQALSKVSAKAGFKEDFSTFKRVANILKDQDAAALGQANPALFEQPEEKALYERFKAIAENDYEKLLGALFGLKPALDAYFGAVMVNAEDAQIKGNRLATMAEIYLAFRQVADIKEISF